MLDASLSGSTVGIFAKLYGKVSEIYEGKDIILERIPLNGDGHV